MNKNSLITKVMVFISTLSLVVGAAVSISIYLFTKNALLNHEKEMIKNEAIDSSHEISNLIQNGEEIAENVSKLEEVKDFTSDGSWDKGQVENMNNFLEKFNIGNHYSAIYILNSSGDTLASTDRSFIGNNYSYRKYFQEAVGGEEVVDFAIGATSGEVGLYFAAPVIVSENVLGIVVAKMKPDYVFVHITKDQDHGQNKIMFTDEFGVVLHSNEEERIFKSVLDLNPKQRDKIKDMKRYINVKIDSLEYDFTTNSIEQIYDLKVFEYENKKNSEISYIVVKRIDSYPFYLISETKPESVFKELDNLAMKAAFMVIEAVIVFDLGIFVFLRNASYPLKELKRHAKKISQGDFDSKLNLERKDELGQLAKAFDEMIDKIKQREEQISKGKKELEKKVAKRTKALDEKMEELEKLNKMMIGREVRIAELKERLKEAEKGGEESDVKLK